MRRPLTAKAGMLALTLLSSAFGSAQTQSVKPGINERYIDPDLNEVTAILESESRDIFRYRHAIVAAMGLEPGMTVADVGAGTGFLTLLLANAVAPAGTVYAVDIDQKLIEHITQRAKAAGVGNIVPVLGGERDPKLPGGSVDVVFIADTYHHFEYPADVMTAIHKTLRANGRVVLVDFERIRGITTEYLMGHVRAGKGLVADEMLNVGFELEKEVPLFKFSTRMPGVPNAGNQYYLVFKKRQL